MVQITKMCTRCKETKDIDAFGRKGKYRQSMCKECKREYNKIDYDTNRQYFLDKVRRRKREIRKFLFKYLSEYPCEICGESNPILLEFAHRDPLDKSVTLANVLNRGWAIKRIEEEIGKCRVLCVKCHRLETAEQNGWYSDLV